MVSQFWLAHPLHDLLLCCEDKASYFILIVDRIFKFNWYVFITLRDPANYLNFQSTENNLAIITRLLPGVITSDFTT